MTPLLISLLAFLGVTAVVGLVMFVLADDGSNRTRDRLDTLTGKRRRDDGATSILRQTAFERDKQSLLEMFIPQLPSLQKLFLQADCNIKPSTLFGVGILLALVGATGSWLAGIKWFVAPVFGVLMFLVPWAWLLNKRRVRLKSFQAQLPDALELVARALRAGHSLAAGLHVVGEEMPSPISDEFNRVYEEQNLGIPIEDALKSMCERVPSLDLRFFVTSVLVQRQTGGDLSEILDKIGYVVRERFRILGQVQALTAEGRLSGVILIALPFGLFLMMLYIKPDYVEKLWTHPLGIKMSVFALIAQLVGAVVIKKIVNIKV
ncbi:MAG: type II secretion system F family protein [Gemmataceae bacterium]|nr:type II secretion system F family protein [Gemmataceae bacterium]